jgi:hypothetical protein
MPQIDVSDETADALFQEILIADYRSLRDQIYELRQQDKLKEYEQEDLENSIRYFEAIKIMMEYYLPYPEAETIKEEKQ